MTRIDGMDKLEGKTILIVEDENDLVKPLKSILERRGHTVLHALDGEAGLKMVKQNKPDVVVLDLLMPVMDGRAMLERMSNSDWARGIPVVILTNISEDMNNLSEMESVSDYLVKSEVGLTELVKRIETVLDMEANKNQP